ncbi:MAG: endonuclease/exonuclease/phosphatase family protein [Myxococcota bacterium]
MAKWIPLLLKILGASLLLLVFTGWLLLRTLNFFPPVERNEKVLCTGRKPQTLKPGSRIRILIWNIQYGGSRKYHFFYDGGKHVHAEKQIVQQNLQDIRKVIQKQNPDIVLFQEIDRRSTRSAYIDQLEALWDPKAFACYTTTPYFKSKYVPTPSHQHMREVDMHLTIFSKFKLQNAVRYALPQLNESFLRRTFNLKRAILRTHIPIEGETQPFVLLNTHLSAFSFGDGTLQKQVSKVQSIVQRSQQKKAFWFLAGDFNMLPPQDHPKRLGKDGDYYNPPKTNPILALFQDYQSGLKLEVYKQNPTLYNTYIPFAAKQPDRWIDHVFTHKDIKVERYQVLQTFLSDHLPILVDVRLPSNTKNEKTTPAPSKSAPTR